ncbi:MAG: HEAT repeat domain-containing protein [Planctomycetaceae bacterium]
MKRLYVLTLAFGLVGCGGDDPESLVARIQSLSAVPINSQREAEGVSASLAETTKKLSEHGEAALPAMIEGLGTENVLTLQTLANAFLDIGAPAVPHLIAAISDPEPLRRKTALDVLLLLHLQNQIDISTAVPQLETATKDSDNRVRQSALSGLYIVAPDVGLPVLLAAINDPDVEIRKNVVQALSMGRAESDPIQQSTPYLEAAGINRLIPAEAAPALIAALDDENEFVRKYAVVALSKLGTHAEPALPRIKELMVTEPSNELGQAFVGIGPAAIETLKELMEHKNPNVKPRARVAMSLLARKHPAALAVMIDGLSSPSWESRYHLVVALGQLGPLAKAAIPEIRKMANDPSPEMRQMVADAIQRIEAEEQEPDGIPPQKTSPPTPPNQ